MTDAPAIPIPVFIGAAAPEAEAVADALLAFELADDVAELSTLLTELLAELSAELPSLLAEESTLENELLMEERREEAKDVTLKTSLEMLELREEESVLDEVDEALRSAGELATQAVPWPAWAEVRGGRVERVRSRGVVSCILW